MSCNTKGTGFAITLGHQNINAYGKGDDFQMNSAIDNFDLIGLTIAVVSLIRVALG